ncbi:MAG TPA: molybdate ABC transporter substrate-binding protein, partial [Planctomycetota bacterium]
MRSLAPTLLLAFASCSPPSGPGPRPELLVQAAVSTRDALLALEPGYESAHGVELVFNFGASGDLAGQILAGAPADLFLSADERELARVEAAGLVLADTRRELLSNQLVVIEPAAGPSLFTAPFEPAQLADLRLRFVSIGDPASVPAGRYARAWLEARGLWSRLAARILPAV